MQKCWERGKLHSFFFVCVYEAQASILPDTDDML